MTCSRCGRSHNAEDHYEHFDGKSYLIRGGHVKSDFWIDWEEIASASHAFPFEYPGRAAEILASGGISNPDAIRVLREVIADGRGPGPYVYTTRSQMSEVLKRWPLIEITKLTFSGFDREVVVSDE